MGRELIDSLNRSFLKIDLRSRSLIASLEDAIIFERPREIPEYMGPFSCGEYLLRSAAMVEKAFGGITTRLWDDPFEWTLPEAMRGRNAIFAYLDEVEETRQRGFRFFSSDDDLTRQIPAPQALKTIFEIILECMARAEHYQGRAFAMVQMLSDLKVPRI